MELAKEAKAIITITGTIGLEGLLLGKLVITLGRTCYDTSPAIIRGGKIPKIKLHKIILKAIDSVISEKDIINFCIAVDKILFDTNGMKNDHPLYFPEVLESENIEKFSKIIKKDLLESFL